MKVGDIVFFNMGLHKVVGVTKTRFICSNDVSFFLKDNMMVGWTSWAFSDSRCVLATNKHRIEVSNYARDLRLKRKLQSIEGFTDKELSELDRILTKSDEGKGCIVDSNPHKKTRKRVVRGDSMRYL